MTTYETMFNLGGSYGPRRVCYIRKGNVDPSKFKCVMSDSFEPGFLALAVISFKARLRSGSSLKGQGQFVISYWQSFEKNH